MRRGPRSAGRPSAPRRPRFASSPAATGPWSSSRTSSRVGTLLVEELSLIHRVSDDREVFSSVLLDRARARRWPRPSRCAAQDERAADRAGDSRRPSGCIVHSPRRRARRGRVAGRGRSRPRAHQLRSGRRSSAGRPDDRLDFLRRQRALRRGADWPAARRHARPPGLARALGQRRPFEVMLDPFLDRRTGYDFTVNPYGVQIDWTVADDDWSSAWDGVWDSATSRSADGFSVEMRIPFSTLRFSSAACRTGGSASASSAASKKQYDKWPAMSQSRGTVFAQLGTLARPVGHPVPRTTSTSSRR